MRLPPFEYMKASSAAEGLAALREFGSRARLLAGGTDLLMNMKQGVVRPEKIVSIRALPELRSLSLDDAGNLSVGACCTLSDLAADRVVAEKFPALHAAAKAVASKHLRNVATLGGNICLGTRCWYYNQSKLWRDSRDLCYKTGGDMCHAIKGSKRCHAINSSDTAPALLALGATVDIQKKDRERRVPLAEFFKDDGAGHTVVEPDEMVTAIQVPYQAGLKTRFIKICRRRGIDFAMASIAVTLKAKGKHCSDVRLIIGSITSAPLVLDKASAVIAQAGLTDNAIEEAAETARSELGTLTNLFNSAGYKRDLVRALVKRALHDLKGRSK